MKKYTNGKELLRPSITRFATNFIALESIIRQKDNLKALFTSDDYKATSFGKMKTGPPSDVKILIMGKDFWKKGNQVLNV